VNTTLFPITSSYGYMVRNLSTSGFLNVTMYANVTSAGVANFIDVLINSTQDTGGA
jgi:hypothetical protein